jgi:Ca2+-binding RTX toxin-like protein
MATINGTLGIDNPLRGTSGNDSIYGLAGDDLIITEDGDDYVEAGDGDDQVNGYPRLNGAYTYYSANGNLNIYGGNGNDFLVGGGDNDKIFGENGNDIIYGRAGNDTLEGGEGDDTLNAQDAGNDFLYGGNGNDLLNATSGTGDKLLDGGSGNDLLKGGDGNDTLKGGDGDDRILTGEGNDSVFGGNGDDEINGFLTSPISHGYTFWNASGKLKLYGDAGNDVVIGGSAGDLISGGDGNDELYGRSGDDNISGDDGNDYVSADDGDDLIYGGSGNDQLFGGNGNDQLLGNSGNDKLYGNEGDDTLDGGDGLNSLLGGYGNDTYYIRNKTDYIYDTQGADTAYVSASFVKIPSSIEKVIYKDGAQLLPYWIDALLPDEAAGNHYTTLLGDSKTFGFIFPTAVPSYDTNANHANGFTTFTATQKARTIVALNYIATVIDVNFRESTNSANLNTITFASNTQSNSGGYALFPSDSFSGNDLFLSNTDNNKSLSDGTFGAYTLMHEIGHTLGLKHPFDEKDSLGNFEDPPYLQGSEDSTTWTYLSYNNTPSQYYFQYSPLDIAALQYLYGPSKSTRTGNDKYIVTPSSANFIWDGAGKDQIDASSSNQSTTIYLTPGYWGYLGATKASTITSAGQITVNFGTVIEILTGSPFADKLYGNEIANTIEGGSGDDLLEGWDGDDSLLGGAGNDSLNGGSGNDSIDGGEGTDTLIVSDTSQNYTIRYNSSTLSYSIEAKTGKDGLDSFVNIEYIKFIDKTALLSTFDYTPPTISITSNKLILANGQSALITFSLSEVSTNFDITDISVVGGALSNFSGSGQSFTAMFNPKLNSILPGIIAVGDLKFTDSTGNSNTDGADANNTLTIKISTVVGETYKGSSINEVFKGTAGNDTIDGGAGVDTAIYTGSISDYYISYNRALGNATITDKRSNGDGIDSLKSVEKLQFADKTFDLNNPPFSSTPTYGKTASFLFDSAYYLLKNPDLIPSVSISNAFDHYIKTGAAAGKAPNTWFDPVYYANKWSDLKPLNLDAATLFMHYNLYGVWEGRSAGPTFDTYDGNRYLKDNSDVAAYVDANVKDFLGSRVNGAIAHYIIYGANESRTGYDSNGQAIDQVILVGTPI